MQELSPKIFRRELAASWQGMSPRCSVSFSPIEPIGLGLGFVRYGLKFFLQGLEDFLRGPEHLLPGLKHLLSELRHLLPGLELFLSGLDLFRLRIKSTEAGLGLFRGAIDLDWE